MIHTVLNLMTLYPVSEMSATYSRLSASKHISKDMQHKQKKSKTNAKEIIHDMQPYQYNIMLVTRQKCRQLQTMESKKCKC